jgi:hypothetical protein
MQIDGDILFGLLKKAAPNVYKHLVSLRMFQLDFFILMTFEYHGIFVANNPLHGKWYIIIIIIMAVRLS